MIEPLKCFCGKVSLGKKLEKILVVVPQARQVVKKSLWKRFKLWLDGKQAKFIECFLYRDDSE